MGAWRDLRIEFGGASYHLTSRGDRREAVYEYDEDRHLLRDEADGSLVMVAEPGSVLTLSHRAGRCECPPSSGRGDMSQCETWPQIPNNDRRCVAAPPECILPPACASCSPPTRF
ncbi:hypothetical protein CKO22_18380 [Thiococcus pfennigii]|nr:hypothetical protein [Thiococcus pfennigii]